MNIALFSDSYIPTKSGVVTVVVQLKKILEQMGHHVVIVTVSPYGMRHFGKDEPDVLRIPSMSSPVGEGQYMGVPLRKKIIGFCKDHNVQIIHSHTEFFVAHAARVTGRALKIPVVATTHTMWEDYYRYYFTLGYLIPRKLVRKIVKNVYHKFYAFINVSEKAKNYFTQPYMLPKTPCAIIPNAIDSEKFIGRSCTEEDKLKLRESLGIKKDDRVIIYVGRVVEEKRVIELLDVMTRVVQNRDNAKMIFVGAGGALDVLQKTVEDRQLEDKILFTGFIDWNKVYTYYAMSDIFVTASLSEMHSMTILEALSMGIPAVCRKDTSYSDTIFPDVDGYFADSDEEMDDCIYDLIDNADKCEAMGARAKEIASRFTLELHGKRTVAFYEEVLKFYPRKVPPKNLQQAVNRVGK